MAQSFDLSNLGAYNDQITNWKLLRKTLLEGETTKYISIQQNIKNQAALNILDHTLTIQAGSCPNPPAYAASSGTTTLTQRNISVCPLTNRVEYCLFGQGSIENYWYNTLMAKGSYNEELPQFSEAFVGHISNLINQQIDAGLWSAQYTPTSSNAHSGDTNSSPTGMGACSSFLNILFNTSASATCVVQSYSGAPTITTIFGYVDAMVASIPTNILGAKDLVIFTSPALVQMYKIAIRNNNNLNYYVSDARPTFQGGDGSAEENTLTQQVPGLNITMIGVYGLVGYNGFILGEASNFFAGFDLSTEYMDEHIYFTWDFETLKATSRWKQGAQIAFPQHIVVY